MRNLRLQYLYYLKVNNCVFDVYKSRHDFHWEKKMMLNVLFVCMLLFIFVMIIVIHFEIKINQNDISSCR